MHEDICEAINFSEREPSPVPVNSPQVCSWECESSAYAGVHSSRRCLGTFWLSLPGDQEGWLLLSSGKGTRTAMITELNRYLLGTHLTIWDPYYGWAGRHSILHKSPSYKIGHTMKSLHKWQSQNPATMAICEKELLFMSLI